ncbi:porin [Nitrosomonas sp.]|uniref:porin n=1 Tax=Nitrosomonas sp. TaxID=42353 RepID=UPI00208D536D|nr:porin [Nitrosomonas sp.]GJL74656.1 MAG: hypothetical protein NMNS02_07620 [Nitrosomonas sp.]
MKKKLISIIIVITSTLTAAIITSAYGADLIIGGRVQSEYSSIDIEGISSQSSIDDPTFYSSWNLKISENLGNGIKALALIDSGFNLSGNIGGARERYVGLSSDSWGQIIFGRIHSPFADFAGGWTIDPFVYTTLQAAGSGGTMIASANGLGAGPYTAVNSVVRFDSVEINGFSFAAMLMPGDANRLEANLGGVLGGTGNNVGNTGGANGEWDFQVAAKYAVAFQAHRFNVFGGYSRDNISTEQKNISVVNLKTEQVGRVGGVWSYKNFRLQGQYEYVSDALGAATCSDAAALGSINDVTRQCNSAMNPGGNGSAWHAGGQYKWGNTNLIVQGGMTDADGTDVFASRKAENFTVGAFHDLSKRSSIFGGYQHVNVEDKNSATDRDRNTWTVGIRHNF